MYNSIKDKFKEFKNATKGFKKETPIKNFDRDEYKELMDKIFSLL